MKTELTLEKRNDFENFDKMSHEEMKKISGGDDLYFEYDKNGNIYIVIKPTR